MGIRNLIIVFTSIPPCLLPSAFIKWILFPAVLNRVHWRTLHHRRVQFFESGFGGLLLVLLAEEQRLALGRQTLRLVLDRAVV